MVTDTAHIYTTTRQAIGTHFKQIPLICIIQLQDSRYRLLNIRLHRSQCESHILRIRL